MHSVLLLGPGGCCKHLLIDFCMNELCSENSRSNPSFRFRFLFLRCVFQWGVYSRKP